MANGKTHHTVRRSATIRHAKILCGFCCSPPALHRLHAYEMRHQGTEQQQHPKNERDLRAIALS